jgi:hypothetical protein
MRVGCTVPPKKATPTDVLWRNSAPGNRPGGCLVNRRGSQSDSVTITILVDGGGSGTEIELVPKTSRTITYHTVSPSCIGLLVNQKPFVTRS